MTKPEGMPAPSGHEAVVALLGGAPRDQASLGETPEDRNVTLTGHEYVVEMLGGTPRTANSAKPQHVIDPEDNSAGANLAWQPRKGSVDARSERAGHTETVVVSRRKPAKLDHKLHSGGALVYPEIVDAKEFNKIVAGLPEEKKKSLFRMVIEFAEAAADESVEPILFRVPKAALSSGAGVVAIPADKLSQEALAKRREDNVKRAQKYRQNLSVQERNELREKDRLRKQLARKQEK